MNKIHRFLGITTMSFSFLQAGLAYGIELVEFGNTIGEKIPRKVLLARIAVSKYDVPPAEQNTNLAKGLSAELITYLAKNGSKVVERDDIGKVLREIELAQKGILKNSHQTLQGSEQIDYIISGTVYRLDNHSLRVATKIIDIRTLAVVFAEDTVISTPTIKNNLEGFHTHDGFSYNFNFGFGYQTTAISDYDTFSRLSLNGPASLLGMKFGWSLDTAWTLSLSFNTLFFGALGTPKINAEPNIITAQPDQTNQLSVTFVGPAVTYYFPSNYFATATIAPASVLYKDPMKETQIDNGYGFSVGLGREWWVSHNWGIGFLIQIAHSRIELKNIDVALTTTRGTVMDNNFVISTWSIAFGVSATYN